MSLRLKLVLLTIVTVVLVVAAVASLVTASLGRAYEQRDSEFSQSVLAQFADGYSRRAAQLVTRADEIASSDAMLHLAAQMSAAADRSQFVEATEQLGAADFNLLELLSPDGTIISSRHWPARFGYKESWFSAAGPEAWSSAPGFFQLIDLPSGPALALLAVRPVRVAASTFYVVLGERIDRDFLRSFATPAGFETLIDYRPNSSGPAVLIGMQDDFAGALSVQIAELDAMLVHAGAQDTLSLSLDPRNPEVTTALHAFPLLDLHKTTVGLLVVASNNAESVRLNRRIRQIALQVALGGILLGVILSSIFAARVTRPLETLAAASDEVARGNFGMTVDDSAQDEIGRLAYAFNRMTRELLDEREKLVQAERVAAWRELARRLAHELKNPLFPLQITVENLLRAREQNAGQFDEVFRESAATLLSEIENLKQIVARFSDFSKMPLPELQRINVNESVRNALKVVQPQLAAPGKPPITAHLELDDTLERETISADPDLLHRALSNLVLNALDAMPQGGTLTLRTRSRQNQVEIHVADTGVGLTPEERSRIFTPYYTSKQRGTGLGLAIVQSIVSDHRGRISVESVAQRGSTFIIELPKL